MSPLLHTELILTSYPFLAHRVSNFMVHVQGSVSKQFMRIYVV